MLPIWIIMLTSLIAAARVTSYGIYEWQMQNKTGAVGVFAIAAACLVFVVLSLIFILTNL